MTERKPPGMDAATWADVQIRAAIRRGEFDNLPGAGKPLPGRDHPDDELWWLKEYARRENLPADALLPPGLALRKQVEQLPDTVAKLSSEQAVRDAVADLNRQITAWLRAPSGPWRAVAPVNAEDVVRQWDVSRRPTTPAEASTTPTVAQPARRRWRWRRLLPWWPGSD